MCKVRIAVIAEKSGHDQLWFSARSQIELEIQPTGILAEEKSK